jgi:hypothetical protein
MIKFNSYQSPAVRENSRTRHLEMIGNNIFYMK